MRVLAVTNMYPTPSHPGAGTFIEQQIEGLRRIGSEIEVLLLDRARDGAAVYRGSGRRIRNAASRFEADLVHVMYGGVMADLTTRAVDDVPVVVSFCGSDLLGEPGSSQVRRLAIRYGVFASYRAARRAAGIIVKSKNLKSALPAGIDERRVWLIPNGVDLERFRPMDRATCTDRLGWQRGRSHVLFPSFPGHPRKRFDLARGAVERLRSSGLEAELHCLQGVDHGDVPIWLNASDCLIVTSTHEGSPNIVKEALACNRPVVSVDVGDVRERVEGVPGCEVVAHTVEELAGALSRALDGGNAAPGAVTGRSRVQDLSLESIARRVLAVYSRTREAFGVGRSAAASERRQATP